MTTMVFAAHPDDEVLGVGGTIAKCAKKEDVIVVIFSQGDSKFWANLMEPNKKKFFVEIVKRRINETKKACSTLGVTKVIFMGLRDMNVSQQIRSRKIEKRIKNIISEYKPESLIYHSNKDGHPDHIAVNKLMTKIIFELDYKPKIMTYQVSLWDFWSTGQNKHFVDVTDTFYLKLKALEKYKSQKKLISLLKKLVVIKGLLAGKRMGVRYAEAFFEV